MQIYEITQSNSEYPALLSEIPSPPKLLYALGELPKGEAVAIVGSRRPTDYGKQVTYQLAYELAQAGIVIVSGLALGIDGIAHQAAIDAGGKTIAVQACGLDQIYPSRHRRLAMDILAHGGAIITEYPVKTIPFPSNFAVRNRIVSGLARAIIVTECDAESGSLITVRHGNDQGKIIMAVPGNITSLRSAGPNNLIRDGAIAITGASDVISEINFDSGVMAAIPVSANSPQEVKILELLGNGVNTSQQLIETGGFSASEFANIISLMEITGKVRNLGAGAWAGRSKQEKTPMMGAQVSARK